MLRHGGVHSGRQRQVELYEFEASLVYIESSKPEVCIVRPVTCMQLNVKCDKV